MRYKSKEVALLAISLLMLASCNEKISPELKSGSTTTTPPEVDPTSFSFKVTETSNANLGYSFHKTGEGNATKSCEITRDTVAFTNDDFIGNNAAYDITCYLDAEELALYGAGMKFKVDASPNACEFVGYQPFSFFSRMPGDSTATFNVVKCGTGTDGDVGTYSVNHSGGAAGCDEYVDQTKNDAGVMILAVGSKRPVKLKDSNDENELCRYDYSDLADGSNCDIGEITINETTLTWDSTAMASTPAYSTRKITCGGKVENCVRGPIKQETQISEFTRGIIVTEVPDGTAHSAERVFPAMIDAQRSKNIEYVNYRRYLASTVANFWDTAMSLVIPGAFLTNSSADYNFEPEVLHYYSLNAQMDGSAYLIDPTTLQTAVGAQVGYVTKPLASEPYVGFADYSSANPADHYDYRVHPFYTFSCLDNAYETTARIRIMVRDWDRIFVKTAGYMETLSDYDYGANARQDRRYYVATDPGDFNNRSDWDDILPMSRQTGAYDPSTTWWAPVRPVFQRESNSKLWLKQWNFPGTL